MAKGHHQSMVTQSCLFKGPGRPGNGCYTITPGFEDRAEAIHAARQAAQDALAGITQHRRSSRTRQQRTDWWMPPQTTKPQPQPHMDREPQPQQHRNRKSQQTEGAPTRRPSQP